MDDSLIRLEMDKVLEKIASHASFSLGKKRVLSTRPIYSKLKLKRELERLQDAMQVLNDGHALSFSGLSDVGLLLQRAEKSSVLAVFELVQVARFMQGVSRLKKQFNNFEETYERLDDLFNSLIINDHVLNTLSNAFSEQGEVLDRASAELRNVRQEIRSLEKRIDDSSESFMKKNKEMLSEQVVSLQQGRRTFLIKPSDKYKIDGTIYGSSASGQSVYFEPAFLASMQNELQGLMMREQEEIERICIEASALIANDALQLRANLETVALIDDLFAKAIWGYQEEASVPVITENSLELIQARHPLISKDEAVLNDYRLGDEYRSILISGPNTGGKSVSLKTIGLAVLLSHSACPVIAKKARVMFVDAVFVDIGDQQSIEKSLSSFSAHLTTIKYVTSNATKKSLILLDELGSQTDPLEGESLAMAILDDLRNKGSWVVATTHFSRLKKYGSQYDDTLMASVEFDLESLKPTYRYKEHIVGESNALAIARRLGINDEILDAAFRYKQESQYEEDHLIEILEGKIQEQERLKEQLAKEEEKLKEKETALDEQSHQQHLAYQLKLEQLEAKHEEKIEELLLVAQEQMEIINKTNRPHERKKAVENIASMIEVEETAVKISVKDRVRIKSSQQIGTVEEIDRKEAKVQIGQMSIQVPLHKLDRVSGPVKKQKQKASHRVKATRSVSLECNVIGKRVAEALPIVNKHLDDCILQGMTSTRIVHGHGTGQLRTAIHQSLRKNKQVKSFSLAPVMEGGAGATVVTLR
ncbi:endonuclease MutS2 [Erysipelothrix urinaevulpis]|uniref:endonuclease MutS2 n=1 Tax=Erysipelothrix urinaevulpis TaxID=2683717 RepID=UPI00135B1ED8|nr:Smr/MutS family protein [Erysipelothrix urinaevulpis]